MGGSFLEKYRLLCVDDQEGIRVLLREVFKCDYDVMTAETGDEAIKIVNDFRPNIVILDMKLQDMGGGEVLESIKRIDDSICVVILTGYDDLPLNCSFNEVNPDMIVHKPFDVFQLKEELSSLMTNYFAIAVGQ